MIANRTRRPYDAAHVQIVDNGTCVTALWIADPELARDPRAALDRICDRTLDIEVVATATRYFKYQGASVPGWIVKSGPFEYSDPIPTKREAMQCLRRAIHEYFNR
mgnify:CR=1 FL=1